MNELNQLIVTHWTEVVTFLLVLGRTSGVVIGSPFWGGASSPKLVRIVLAVGLGIAVFPFALPTFGPPEHANFSLLFLLLMLGREVLIGLSAGWMAQLLFAGMRMAGQHIEIKMGLGLTQLVDPHDGGQTSLMPALMDLLASLVFLAVNGHHLLIRALVSSYRLFPLAVGASPESAIFGAAPGGTMTDLLRLLIGSASEIFPIALRVSAPIVIGSLLADVVLGVISRMVPQLNLFAVILPAQFAFGLLLFLLALPLVVWFCVDQLATIGDHLNSLFAAGQ
ncbi:MAG: flagellar biosynthetic protein FliR [Candidatus Binatia bacterium]